ncbi:hypothetical protein [Hymenobacter cellulosivorans]|uniref:Outer membrane protein beta-barrel domain-containing protein n=1 Tax=Hymenobacter cellulosivorans TaxID=2932249 RepID=A0ABY4FB08_9BACT|nr:hypothetical protein [Hymenobacter cellulosivorans]UOQ53844.1 hypothetical protein MUN80_03560 [Hymenobacter cellulosivorans]
MNIRLTFLGSLLLFSLYAHTAAAQSPERRRRHFTNSARPYHRGPVYLTLGGGAGFYNGDLAESFADNLPGPSGSVGVLYMVRPRVILGSELSVFKLGAKDQLPERGYAFRSTNGALTGFVRYELTRDESEFADSHGPPAMIKPYIKAGVGALLYTPEAYLGNARPVPSTNFLPTERNDYPATALIAPVGLGLTFRLMPQLNVSAEGSYYFTTTDHLDDISQRGNAARNDGFGLMELKLEYSPWR